MRKQTPSYWSRWSFLELSLTASCLAQCFCFSNLLEPCSVPLVGQQGSECWLASETEIRSNGDDISTFVNFPSILFPHHLNAGHLEGTISSEQLLRYIKIRSLMWTGFPFSLNKMQTGVDGISWNVWSVMARGSIQLILPPLVYTMTCTTRPSTSQLMSHHPPLRTL